MNINISGCNDNIKLQVYQYALESFVNVLFPQKYIRNNSYVINIFIKQEMPSNTYAETRWSDCPFNPRVCTIEIKNIKNNLKMLHTLAHELVHVKQIFTKQLKDDVESDTDYIWAKKRYNIVKDDYLLLPWEIEANGYEVALVEKFRSLYSLSLNDLKNNLPMAIQKIKSMKLMSNSPRDTIEPLVERDNDGKVSVVG